jgi:hypothetical protein
LANGVDFVHSADYADLHAKPKVIVMTAAALVVLLAIGACILWPQPNRITPQNFDRIRVGMSRGEVVAILGPPGDYTTAPSERDWERYRRESVVLDDNWLRAVDDRKLLWSESRMETWDSDAASAIVIFDASDRVFVTDYRDNKKEEQTLLENLAWRAKRQWRKWFPE